MREPTTLIADLDQVSESVCLSIHPSAEPGRTPYRPDRNSRLIDDRTTASAESLRRWNETPRRPVSG